MEHRAVDELVLTCNLAPEALGKVVEAANRTGVRVERWSCIRQPVGGA